MSRVCIYRNCPYCKNKFSKLWFHIKKYHKEELNDYESVVLKIMGISKWPTYEIDGVIYKYKFSESGLYFLAQTRKHWLILAYKDNPELRKKVSEATLKAFDRPGVRDKIKIGIRNSCNKPEVIEHKREAMRKVWQREDYRQLLSELRTGTKRSEETKKKMSESIKLAFKAKNLGKKVSEARKKFYEEHGYYSGYMDPNYFKYRNKSKLEYKFGDFMKSIGINVISHSNHFIVFDRNLNRFNCYPDFLIEYKGYKLLVEFDGKYHHPIDIILYEVIKDYSLYKLYGLKVLRIFDTVAFDENFLKKKLDWVIVNKPYFYEYKDIETIYKMKESLNPINYLDDIKLLEYKV